MTTWLDEAYTLDALFAAWELVRRKHPGPGVDGVTVEQFTRHLDEHLRALRRDMRRDTYQPAPLLRRYLPKADGEFRRVGIPTILDRLAQRALLQAALPRIDSRLHPASYAYRPGRNIQQATLQIDGWRAAGGAWVARADIDLCFDSIPHAPLLARVQSWLGDERAVAAIARWLTAGVIDGDTYTEGRIGTPQGDILSPVLCNIYLDQIDRALARHCHSFVRYADDILIVSHTQSAAEAALARAAQAFTACQLHLDPQKSRVVSFQQGFKYLGTLFVGSLVLPCVQIVHADGHVSYTQGYDDAPSTLSVVHTRQGLIVTAHGGAGTEPALTRAVAEEVHRARAGAPTAVGQALLAAWRNAKRARTGAARAAATAGPADWAFVI